MMKSLSLLVMHETWSNFTFSRNKVPFKINKYSNGIRADMKFLKTRDLINKQKAESMVTIVTHTLCCVSMPHDLIQRNKHQALPPHPPQHEDWHFLWRMVEIQ